MSKLFLKINIFKNILNIYNIINEKLDKYRDVNVIYANNSIIKLTRSSFASCPSAMVAAHYRFFEYKITLIRFDQMGLGWAQGSCEEHLSKYTISHASKKIPFF